MKEDVSYECRSHKYNSIIGLSQWENWSQCSTTCGNGNKLRQRSCQDGTCPEALFDSTTCFKKGC